IARFAELGFPTTKQEEWRFTSVAPIAETAFTLSRGRDTAHVTAQQLEPLCVGGLRAVRVVFVDGAFAPSLSAVAGLSRGVRAESLAAALERDPELARHHLARYAPYQASPFAALNTAFLCDGAFVYVPAGVEFDRPIELVFVATAGDGPTVSHPRSLVVVERGAQVTVIDHAQPHCASHEFFNGIVGEQGHGVFNGRIIVRPGAQRTDSKQTNNNLLLSTAARADSQPQLEIYADDVKCTHGSTVGPLDQTALYYLRSRGLSPETAAGMLTYGFAIRATEAYEAARERVARFLNAWAPEGVVFTRGTTEAINLVAGAYGRANLRQGDMVVVTAMDHHSNLVPWQILCQEKGAVLRMVEITEDGRIDLSDYGQALERRPKIVAFPYVSNSLGTVNPAGQLIRLAHAVGAV